MVLEKTLGSPLDCKEIQPVNSKGDQSWIYIRRTDADAEAPIIWPPEVKKWLIWKNPDAGKDWRKEEKGMTEDEMVGWHHWLDGHEFEQALGVGDGQLDTTEWLLNWIELIHTLNGILGDYKIIINNTCFHGCRKVSMVYLLSYKM